MAGNRKRKQPATAVADARQASGPRRRTLQLKTKSVSEHTLQTKWKQLSSANQERLLSLLKAQTQPVVQMFGDGDDDNDEESTERAEAQAALNAAVEKFAEKIPGLSAPPRTRDTDFDQRNLQETAQYLQGELTKASHQARLLQEELKQEEAWLEQEKRKVQEEEAELQNAENARRKNARPQHPLLSSLESNSTMASEARSAMLGLVDENTPPIYLSEEGLDADEKIPLGQLCQILTDLQGDAGQAQELSEAMSNTRAALESLLDAELPAPHAQLADP